MYKLRLQVFVISLAFFSSCNSKKIDLGSIDRSDWKKDKFGCAGLRTPSLDKLSEYKDNLLRHSETEIIKELGLPDKAELIGHSEKYYTYHIDPAVSCNQRTHQSSKYLRIRFNSVGHAREVLILDEKR